MGNDNKVDILIRSKGDTKGIDETNKGLKNLEGHSGGASKATAMLGMAAKASAAAVAAAGVAIGTAGVMAVKSAGEYEQSRIAFDTMLGSADKARGLMQQIAEFAKSTPFELPEVVQGTKQLLAFGFAQDQLLPTMRKLGDLASGLGVPVGQLTTVFGQVRVAGRLMGQDLLQFTNAGVPLIEALAVTMKKPQGEIKKLVEQGKVGFPEVEAALNHLTGEGSKFGGMMEKQSKTFNGVVSNIKDGFGQMLRSAVGITAAGDIIEGSLFDRIKNGSQKVMPLIQRAAENAGPAMERLINFISGLAQKLEGPVKQAIEFLRPSFEALWKTIETSLMPALQKLWKEVIEPMLPVLGVVLVGAVWLVVNALNVLVKTVSAVISIGSTMFNFWTQTLPNGLSTAFTWIVEKLTWLKDNWSYAIGWIIGFVASLPAKLITYMGAAVVGMINAIRNVNWGHVASVIWQGFVNAFNTIKNAAGDAFNYMRNLNWGSIISGIGKGIGNSVISMIEGAINGALSGIPGSPRVRIPRFAKGVRNFEGGLAVVGEEGPELVGLPKGSSVFTNKESRQMASGGGGTVIQNLNIYPQTAEASKEIFRQLDNDTLLGNRGFTPLRGGA